MSRMILRNVALSATALVFLAEPLPLLSFGHFVQHAEARVGQPWTAASGAGVARRTTRRSIRRSTVFVAALPPTCIRTTIDGIILWRCGATYYQRHSGGYVVIHVD